MADDQGVAAERQSIGGSYGTVRRVGKLEAAHGVEADHPDPIRHEGILTPLGCQDPAIRMRYHLGPEPPKHDGAEMVIRMMVSQNQPFDRLSSGPANGLDQLLCLLRTGQCVDYNDARAGDDEARVGPAFGATTRVPQGSIDIGSQTANGRGRRNGDSGAREERGEQNRWRWKTQAEPKLMLIDCLKVAPLLSDHTMLRGASLSALRVKLTTGSRLIPEVHSNRATSWLP